MVDIATAMFGTFGKNILTVLLLIVTGLSGWVLTETFHNGEHIAAIENSILSLAPLTRNLAEKGDQLEHRITSVEQRLTDHEDQDARMYPAPTRR